jgi:hypothetical protein
VFKYRFVIFWALLIVFSTGVEVLSVAIMRHAGYSEYDVQMTGRGLGLLVIVLPITILVIAARIIRRRREKKNGQRISN